MAKITRVRSPRVSNCTALARGALEALGLVPAAAGAVGALSNAASHQTVPWPTAKRARGWNVVRPPAKWSPETMARAARLASTGRRAAAGLLNGFLMLVSRGALDAVGLLDDDTYPGGYGEENDWCVRARRAGFGLYVAVDVHVFHEKTASYSEQRKAALKAVARENSRRKWAHGEVRAAEALLKASPALAFARRAAEGQYTGWRAKLLGAGPSAALVLAEGDAAPDWLQNDATGALVRSCDANARSCAEYLASAAFDYVVSTGPRGAAKADILARCHPRVVHVRRPAAAAASSS